MPVNDGAGFHVAKVNNAMPRHFEAVQEAAETAREREGIPDRELVVLTDEDDYTFSVSLGTPRAKRAFESACDDLAENSKAVAEVRTETIDRIKAKRESAGLGAYEDTPEVARE